MYEKINKGIINVHIIKIECSVLSWKKDSEGQLLIFHEGLRTL